ncbi:hypothetical protein SKAU_G00224250 [Synaphobranchus kaupii]|uniref:Uncharacterized protein n=1 Tax=Synaphobranchus kaupii TaxID=118154 RepID=A0A9Q1IWC8_SYNKA|nr:hypothetical protein SKAU_G00224250 [Synaphobranchus kaupii]
METYCVVLGTAGLIFAIINAQTVDHFKRCLLGVADSISLILLSFIHIRVSLRRHCVYLLHCLRKVFIYAWKRECESDKTSEDASGVNRLTSEITKFIGESIGTVSEIVDGVSRLLRGLLSLCVAALHLFQGTLCLITALVHFGTTVIVYALSYYRFSLVLVISELTV